MSDSARWTPDGVPDHAHITVDEETYWGLYYVYAEVRRAIDSGEISVPGLKYLVRDAERRLEDSRRWNDLDPGHATVTSS